MAHQLIHTSCKRGISNQKDGFQIYSFDSALKSELTQDSAGYYKLPEYLLNASYDVPGSIVLDEQTISLAPIEFAFEAQNSSNRLLFIRRNPSRDYTNERARFGNVFKHFIICQPDEVNHYPSEYYDSEMLRYNLTADEANSDDVPALLPSPSLTVGSGITVNRILDFLSQENRCAILRNMVYALLHSSKGDKKILICDRPENVILWIAAMEYLLPLNLAKTVSFTTYTKKPESSYYWICGVVPDGTEYDCSDTFYLNKFYVFDIINNVFTDITDDDGALYDSIELTADTLYTQIQRFHDFLQQFPNVEIGPSYADAYSLYELQAFGFSNIDSVNLQYSIRFLNSLPCNHPINQEITKEFLSDASVLLELDNTRFFVILTYLTKHLSHYSDDENNLIKKVIIDKIVNSFTDSSITEEEFKKVLSLLSQSFSKSGVDSILSSIDVIERLSNALSGENPFWKCLYLQNLYSSFIMQNNLPEIEFENGQRINELYKQLLSSCRDNASDSYCTLVTSIMETYYPDKKYLLPIVIMLENISDEGLLKSGNINLWELYCNEFKKSWSLDSFDWVNTYLIKHKLHQKSYSLYVYMMDSLSSDSELDQIFNAQCMLLTQHPEYGKLYLEKTLGYQWNCLDVKYSGNQRKRKSELLQKYIDSGMTFPRENVSSLDSLIENVSFDPISSDNKKLLNIIVAYHLNEKIPLEGYLLLLAVGNEFDSKIPVADKINRMQLILGSNKLTPSKVFTKERETLQYLKWIIPTITEMAVNASDLLEFYHIFTLTESEVKIYASICTDIYCHKITKKGSKIIEYISFISQIEDKGEQAAFSATLLKKLKTDEISHITESLNRLSEYEDGLRIFWEDLLSKPEESKSGFISLAKKIINVGKKEKK